jgi:hypothetical protein
MVTSEHCVSQIVETLPTCRATISLPMALGGVVAVLDNVSLATMRAQNTIGPAQLTHHLIALVIINQPLD